MSEDDLIRADKLLTQVFPKINRNQIQNLIENRLIEYLGENQKWILLEKSSHKFCQTFAQSDNWRIRDSQWTRFVSRAGIKLQGAIDHWQINVKGLICLDVGLSTGGFSHCLLQNGVKRILGIDVGKNQLHKTLSDLPQLISLEGVNAREPLPALEVEKFFAGLPPLFDLMVIDVSFISLGKIIGNLVDYLKPGGKVVALVKPQFELGPEALNKNGVVKKSLDPFLAVEKNLDIFTSNKLNSLAYCLSPIEGDDGNKEFFIYGQKTTN